MEMEGVSGSIECVVVAVVILSVAAVVAAVGVVVVVVAVVVSVVDVRRAPESAPQIPGTDPQWARGTRSGTRWLHDTPPPAASRAFARSCATN